MRVDGLGRTIVGGATARPAAGGATFRIADGVAAEAPRQAAPMRPAHGLDALLALQAMPDATVERRKRAVTRGRGLLDALDDLRIGLIEGRADAIGLVALRQRLDQGGEATGDAGLDEALAAIELRVAVEIAKRKG